MDDTEIKNIECGIIYRLTSPSNKKYVGQTIQEFQKRVNAHNYSAKSNDPKRGCPILNKAIRKYGIDNFKQEIIIELYNITQEELDINEIEQIKINDCLYPNGYNLSPGGTGKLRGQTQLERQKRSDSLRKYSYKDLELPMYFVYYNKPPCEGFRLNRPGVDRIIISTKKLSMDEKYEFILSMLEMEPEQIAKIKNKRQKRCRKDNKIDAGDEFKLPMYVTFKPGKYESFSVRKPGYSERKFSSTKLTKMQKYYLAINYLELINTLEEFNAIDYD